MPAADTTLGEAAARPAGELTADEESLVRSPHVIEVSDGGLFFWSRLREPTAVERCARGGGAKYRSASGVVRVAV